jgi:hypothetical protein
MFFYEKLFFFVSYFGVLVMYRGILQISIYIYFGNTFGSIQLEINIRAYNQNSSSQTITDVLPVSSDSQSRLDAQKLLYMVWMDGTKLPVLLLVLFAIDGPNSTKIILLRLIGWNAIYTTCFHITPKGV